MTVSLSVMCVGCASVLQNATTTSHTPIPSTTNVVTEIREAHIRVRALGGAKTIVEQLRVSNGKTQSLGAKGISEESSMQDLVELIKALGALKTP